MHIVFLAVSFRRQEGDRVAQVLKRQVEKVGQLYCRGQPLLGDHNVSQDLLVGAEISVVVLAT